jgi:alanyl-tRNA synthetase
LIGYKGDIMRKTVEAIGTKIVGELFLDFYHTLGYEIISSSSLLDDSVPMSFVMSAGMVQFEKLSREPGRGKHYALIQNCFRHFDLDKIGSSNYHLSLFQMPGAFDFGPMDRLTKVGQIWDLLTGIYGFDPEQLWVTYFCGDRVAGQNLPADDAAAAAWKTMGIAPERIVGQPYPENFWRQSARLVGKINSRRCGPTTEVFLDRGEHLGCHAACRPGCKCGRFVEFQNTLFITWQVQEAASKLALLDEPFTETVIGLERVAALLQGKNSVYEIDNLQPLIQQVHCFAKPGLLTDLEQVQYTQLLVDHLRALSFLTADGAPPPGHGGRRRLMRILVRELLTCQRLLGISDSGFLRSMFMAAMPIYPSIAAFSDLVAEYIGNERQRYFHTIQVGLNDFEQLIEQKGVQNISEVDIQAFEKERGLKRSLLSYFIRQKTIVQQADHSDRSFLIESTTGDRRNSNTEWANKNFPRHKRKVSEIEEEFLNFFTKQDYTILPGSSLLDESIPMSFVMSAGLVQVERAARLADNRPRRNAVLIQNCFRHFDLDKIETSDTHLSLFRMAGAFCFGSIQKRSCLKKIWSLLTVVYQLPPELLWATYFSGDQAAGHDFEEDVETRQAWLEAGLKREHLVGQGEKDNLWKQSARVMGPGHSPKCGPITEVFYDRGSDMGCGENCRPGCGCGRFVEFMNILFIMWDFDVQTGQLMLLEEPFEEVVLGVERLAMLQQKATSVYEIDTIQPLLQKVRQYESVKELSAAEQNQYERILVDHLRALLFLVADGAPPPGKGGRDFIMRKLIRQMLTGKRLLCITDPNFFTEMLQLGLALYVPVHPAVREARGKVLSFIAQEQECFERTLQSGYQHAERLISKSRNHNLPKSAIQNLEKSYGVPKQFVDRIIEQKQGTTGSIYLPGKEASMATDRIFSIFHSIDERIKQLLDLDRFYAVLLDPVKAELSFPFRREGHQIVDSWPSRPYQPERWLPDQVIKLGEPALLERDFTSELKARQAGYWPDEKPIQSWLGMPLISGDQCIGLLVAESWRKPDAFGKDGLRVLSVITRQAAMAIDNARLYKRLERRAEQLRVVNEIGQRITAGVSSDERKILETIYQEVRGLPLDTRNMYISLYDSTLDQISFGLAYLNGHRVNTVIEAGWQPRKPGGGRTEEIVRSKQPILTRTKADAEAWYSQRDHQDFINQKFASWVGVPIIYGDNVLGVIATFHETEEYKYDRDDMEVLQILAGQIAVALQNARLFKSWQKEQEKVIATERLSVMSSAAAEFAHKMSNLAGTIPVRVNLAKAQLDPLNKRDAIILKQLEHINADTQQLLQASQGIKASTDRRAPELVNVNDLIDIALGRGISSDPGFEQRIKIIKRVNETLPNIFVERNKLLDTLTNIIKNGMEAISGSGELIVLTRRSQDRNGTWIEISVADSGKGISESDLPKIFDLFYTTKVSGLGFGLWRDKAFIKEIGGDIEVESKGSSGTTFTIKIPIQSPVVNY